MAEMSSLLKEARELNATLEGEGGSEEDRGGEARSRRGDREMLTHNEEAWGPSRGYCDKGGWPE